MRARSLFFIVTAVATVAVGVAAAADRDPVPLFTGEDLDRMFGPAPAQPSDPVDRTRPEDWRWVEQFLDRQYARIDADRRYDLDTRTVDIAEQRVAPARPYYGGYAAWGLGYPASTWWNRVASSYWYGGHDHDGGYDRGHGGGHRGGARPHSK